MNTPIMTFGPVTVLSKRLSSSGSTVAVKLQQQVYTTYPPGSQQHLALSEALNGNTARVVKTLRKATQRLLPEEAAILEEGQEIAGHLVRTITALPKFYGQAAAYEGGYASCCWHPAFAPDIDLRATLQ